MSERTNKRANEGANERTNGWHHNTTSENNARLPVEVQSSVVVIVIFTWLLSNTEGSW